MHAAQFKALMAFAVVSMAGKIDEANIGRALQDQPVPGVPSLTFRRLAAETEGISSSIAVDESGTPTLYTVANREETWEIQIWSRLGDAPDPDLDANSLMDDLELDLQDDQATYAMRKLALAPKRVGEVLDISAVGRGSQWETRASLTVVFSLAQIKTDTATKTVESMDLEGTLSPVSGTVSGTIGP